MSKTYLLQNLPTNMTKGDYDYIDNLENTSLYDSLNLSGGAIEAHGGSFLKRSIKAEKQKKDIKTCENYKSSVEKNYK